MKISRTNNQDKHNQLKKTSGRNYEIWKNDLKIIYWVLVNIEILGTEGFSPLKIKKKKLHTGFEFIIPAVYSGS